MVHSGLALNKRYGMAGFASAVKRRTRQIACAIAQESKKADDFWKRPGFSNPILGGFRDPVSEFIAPLVPVFCDIPPGDEEPITFPDDPGFTGGQCDTLYLARVQVTTDNPNATPIDREQEFSGPLFGLKVDDLGNGVTDVYVEHGLDSDGNRGRTTIISGGFQVESSNFTNLGRVDGLPDDCGDPPGGGGTPDDVEVCYDTPDGTEVCVRVPIGGGPPTVRPDGGLNVPVRFDFPDGPITVDLPIGGGEPIIKPGGGTPGASPCCPPFSPDSPEPPPNQDDPPPPDGEEQFIGLIVKIETVGARRAATELDGGGISLFIPRAAVISIAIDIGGRRTWTADVNIRKRNQYVPVPSPGVGYTWAIYNEPGFTTTVTPVLVEVPANE